MLQSSDMSSPSKNSLSNLYIIFKPNNISSRQHLHASYKYPTSLNICLWLTLPIILPIIPASNIQSNCFLHSSFLQQILPLFISRILSFLWLSIWHCIYFVLAYVNYKLQHYATCTYTVSHFIQFVSVPWLYC